ncbi:MAG: site-specific DNA-methyltransferase [Candidatus Heimdallarchaeum endolithica]|uniref:Type II methyltransferase n=1 Tax=Candidatus Heimdallarchaeum endolithica TaxID=2876572 RepID=A0A9Y1BQM8_9ARCH|nr:MAG: site-specific DNA-methyltransferase [Candidatus Heimdallarchaeum endolithica]
MINEKNCEKKIFPDMKLCYEEKYLENNYKETNNNFELETTTVWSFQERGNWSSHKGDYRGNFAPQIPKNIVLRYSKEGEVVLDPMVGSGTTLIETKLLKRKGIGIDVNKKPLQITEDRLKKTIAPKGEVDIKLYHGDARNLNEISDESVNLICTHPPYLNIIQYSFDNPNDLSQIKDVEQFFMNIKKITDECFRVLVPNRILALLIGDTRRNRHYIPLSLYVLKAALDSGFLLMEDIIKHQWNCKSTDKWKEQSLKYNFHLIMHEHLYILRKPRKNEDISNSNIVQI